MAKGTLSIKIGTNLPELIELLETAEKQTNELKTTLAMIENRQVKIEAN